MPIYSDREGSSAGRLVNQENDSLGPISSLTGRKSFEEMVLSLLIPR